MQILVLSLDFSLGLAAAYLGTVEFNFPILFCRVCTCYNGILEIV